MSTNFVIMNGNKFLIFLTTCVTRIFDLWWTGAVSLAPKFGLLNLRSS